MNSQIVNVSNDMVKFHITTVFQELLKIAVVSSDMETKQKLLELREFIKDIFFMRRG